MTGTSAGWKPALRRMPVDLDFYGFCLRLYSGFFGTGGGAWSRHAWRRSVSFARRRATVMERRRGESVRTRSGNSVGDDEGASRAVWKRADLHALGSAGEGGTCGFAGRDVERVAARGRYAAGHDCDRSPGAGAVIRLLAKHLSAN